MPKSSNARRGTKRPAKKRSHKNSTENPRKSHGAAPSDLSDLRKKHRELEQLLRQAEQAAGTPDRYERHRQAAAGRQKEQSRAGREIGELPPIADPARRAAALASLRLFNETYFKHRFYLAWSPDQLEAMAKIEQVALQGGRHALAMPRGSGKTGQLETAALWAALKGIRQFLLLIGASRDAALEMIESIKAELEGNELLQADFPEVCHAVGALEGIANRCKGQLYEGERTRIEWKRSKIIFPTIAGSAASGVIIAVTGITGRIRGMKHTRPDGRIVRPDLVLLDDVQTEDSARSPSQCDKREKIIAGAVLNVGGPDRKIAAFFLATVIERGDLADRYLDRDRHPEWTGRRYKMVYQFPKNMGLWEEYAARRADELRNDGDGSQATEFYRQNRAAMDEGAVVAWPERFHPGELSGIQRALNFFFDDKAAFFAEGQGEPLTEDLAGEQLDAELIAKRVNGLVRGMAPLAASRVTAFIDVQQKCLYYLVVAWADDFGGAILDYGTWPDQGRRYFTHNEVQKTLSRACPRAGLEAAIFNGLGSLAGELLGLEWRREDGIPLKIERLLIDANFGTFTEIVYTWCRRSGHAAIAMPSHGRGIGPANKPWSEYKPRPGEKLGFHWTIAVGDRKRATRYVTFDTNFWKTFICERLKIAVADRGALSLWGKSDQDHRLLADHFTSEYFVRTEGHNRTVNVWKHRPQRFDNHWWDCAIGAAVAASIQGAALPENAAPKPKAKYVSYSELYRQARERERQKPRI